jgi:hypothetical protein
MKRERPILWEEDERDQRAAARFMATFLVVCVALSAAHSFWWRDWDALWSLAENVVAVGAGVLVWSAFIWLISNAGAVTADLVRTLTGKNRDV